MDVLKIFADDTKSENKVESQEGINALQTCINNMNKWSELWQIQFVTMSPFLDVVSWNHR